LKELRACEEVGVVSVVGAHDRRREEQKERVRLMASGDVRQGRPPGIGCGMPPG